jgi:hypothetical protein
MMMDVDDDNLREIEDAATHDDDERAMKTLQNMYM